MNTKIQLQLIIDLDKTYNKSATRYLYKTHPDLWNEIIQETNFLPDDAKPKQRIWHILNEIYERPKCPITNEFVKWYENRYLETIDRSAKNKLMVKNDKFKNQTESAKRKRKDTLIEGYKTGRIKPVPEEKRIRGKEMADLVENAMLEKYGVKNAMFCDEIYAKYLENHPSIKYGKKFGKMISDGWVASGKALPISQRDERTVYFDQVQKFTKESWVNYFDIINPTRLERGKDYHLDHIYSIKQGFIDNIPPYIIGHWTNLRIISQFDNDSKGMTCHKTQDKLFEDFFESFSIG